MSTGEGWARSGLRAGGRTAAVAAAVLVTSLVAPVQATDSTSGADAQGASQTPPLGAAEGSQLKFQALKRWDVPGSMDSGFGVSKNGQVYFYDRVENRIHHYRPGGKQVRTWKVDGSVHGLAVAPTGRVVVLERGLLGSDPDRVVTFSAEGELLSEFDITAIFTQAPTSLALAPGGDIYVASDVEVVRFTPGGVKVYDWGDLSGSISELISLAVAPNGTVLVVDRSEHRVKRFSATGQLRKQWGQFGTGRGQFGYPTSVDVDTKGRVYVADPGEATASRRVQVFGSGGKFLTQIGGPHVFESTPRTVRVDGKGRVFVYDDGHHWGTHIRSFGPRRAAPRIVPKQIRVKGRTTKVRIRCVQGAGQCRGKLILKHRKQSLAKRNFTLKAGKAKVFNVRLTVKGKRILTRQKPKKIRIVANPNGSKKVKKMVRVR